MEISNSYVLSAMAAMPWAIHPGMVDVFTEVLNNNLANNLLKPQRVEDPEDAISFYNKMGNKAIIPLHGVYMKKTMGMEGMSGFYTHMNIEQSMKMALDDDSVEQIILDIDSPGGTIDGLSEISDLIYNARQQKNIITYGNGLMASAAYWMGSAADEIYTNSVSIIGSIGVYRMHINRTEEANEASLVKVTMVKAGKYKALGSSHEPMSDLALEESQAQVDYMYSLFIENVARNRNVSTEDVATKMAEGRVFIGKQAKDVGLVDDIVNFDEVIGMTESNKYYFLKGEAMRETKLKDATAAQLMEENAEVHGEVFDAGVASVSAESNSKVSELEAEVTQLKGNMKILEMAAKVGMVDEGKKAIEDGLSVEDALALLLVSKSENSSASVGHDSFVSTAAQAAGEGAEGDVSDEDEPKTGSDAMAFCRKKFSLTKKDAWMKAKIEYPNLFNGGYATHTQKEERV